MHLKAPKEGQTYVIKADQEVHCVARNSEVTEEALLGSLVSRGEEGPQGVHWPVQPAKPLNLLYQIMSLHGVNPQMMLPSALEKDVGSLNAIPLHVAIAPLLRNTHPLVGHFIMVEGMLMKEIVIGNNVIQHLVFCQTSSNFMQSVTAEYINFVVFS